MATVEKRFIRLVTEIPGPKSREILADMEQYVPQAFGVHLPVAVHRGEGALFTDVDGNTFIDLAGGIGVMAVGHSHPAVVRTIQEHAARFTHTDFTVVMYEPYVRLARRLAALAPGKTPKKAAFFNSGAEAIENAVKIARSYTGRPALIAFEGAFHGRTLMALSLTSKTKPYKRRFTPFAPEVYRVPFPYAYRAPFELSEAELTRYYLSHLERAFVTHVAPEDVAAIVVEPVQGEGGFVVPTEGFLEGVRTLCDRHGILLIVDEIQTGFGRTGKLFASEHFGIEPDLLVVAKSLAAGMPLSGVVGKREIMDAPGDGELGGTYVGNPIACAVANTVLDIMAADDLPGRAAHLGGVIRRRFEAWRDRFALVGDVRGLGAMMAVELVKDRKAKTPAADETYRVLQYCLQHGVLAVKAGIYGNVLRMLPPLVITDEQLSEALDVVEAGLEAAAG